MITALPSHPQPPAERPRDPPGHREPGEGGSFAGMLGVPVAPDGLAPDPLEPQSSARTFNQYGFFASGAVDAHTAETQVGDAAPDAARQQAPAAAVSPGPSPAMDAALPPAGQAAAGSAGYDHPARIDVGIRTAVQRGTASPPLAAALSGGVEGGTASAAETEPAGSVRLADRTPPAARNAVQVAVRAVEQGIRVVTRVAALDERERQELRDAIQALLAEHGLATHDIQIRAGPHPRAASPEEPR